MKGALGAIEVYHARWMAKALYCIKIWLFKQQFQLTKREQKGIEDVCLFIVLVYVKAWFSAPLPTSAPRNDLAMPNPV